MEKLKAVKAEYFIQSAFTKINFKLLEKLTSQDNPV
jgi:hypothetical protein